MALKKPLEARVVAQGVPGRIQSKEGRRKLAVLKRVKRTGRPVVITRFGEPIAEVVPPTALERQDGWLGAFDSRGRIVGDIIAPAAGEQEWEVLRE